MRQLILFRHAKSDWSVLGQGDHNRRLAARGVNAAGLMGRWLHQVGLVPDLILCSTAQRTRETLALAWTQWPERPEVRYDEQLYLGSVGTMLRVIHREADTQSKLMVIGHNPGMWELAVSLVRDGAQPQTKGLIGKFPTASVAVVQFEIPSWGDLALGTGELVTFQRPKALA